MLEVCCACGTSLIFTIPDCSNATVAMFWGLCYVFVYMNAATPVICADNIWWNLCSNKLSIHPKFAWYKNRTYLRQMKNGKGYFLREGCWTDLLLITLNGPWLERPVNFKMCRGGARSPNTVGTRICKKLVPQLIEPGANMLPFHCDFCDTPRTAEATSRHKALQARVFDGMSFVVSKAYLWYRAGKKRSCCKTVVLFNDLWRENKNAEKIRSAYKIQTYPKLSKNVGKKPQHVFGGPGRKVILGRFYHVSSWKAHTTSSIKRKIRRTCWH